MENKTGLSEIRSKIDNLLDDIEDAINTIDMEREDIEGYVSEIKRLMVESGEKLGN